ncbi:heat shock 70 kDa protein 12A-like [Ostrea edulis]|uniref:heat shock 70 kDa protein 12A-like n=1 Tax=Ostrea edulis TaxID=37623 RepID=UPI0024AEB569|nr:heat shock 70 kDa protein 12A-like [Ostrea edulis]
MDTEINPWPVVCAIDFGTTYSGYAYSMRTDYERNPLCIEANPAWFNDGQGTMKTPTCILFDKSKNFHSFGYEAERKYASLAEKAQEGQNGDEDEDDDDEDDEDDEDSGSDEKERGSRREDNLEDWLFFRRFKMNLFQNEDSTVRRRKLNKLHLSAENGEKLPALTVFSEAIRYLKRHFESLLENTTLRQDGSRSNSPIISADDAQQLSDDSECTQNSNASQDNLETMKNSDSNVLSWSDDILWVLTVPAIWSDEAKQFMREAAIQAGIEDDKLVLALEPESAALLCKQLALTKGVDDINIKMFDTGSKFMVVDCGGGTVDVTAYEVKDSNSLREIHCASGNDVGGTNVDRLFFDLIQDIFGKKAVKCFKDKSPSDYLELLRSFETKKRGIEQENPDEEKAETITFSNLSDLFKECSNANQYNDKAVTSRIQEMGLKKKIKSFSRAKLRFDANYLIEAVFKGPISAIVSHLQNLYQNEKVAEIDIILLVGGFSECPLLRKAIRAQFPNRNVINPREGSIAVMKGAVLFGHSPENMIRKYIQLGQVLPSNETQGIIRKSKAYYGVATDVPFIEDEHSQIHKFIREGGEVMCTDIFDCLIEKNQELRIDTVIEKTFCSSNCYEANVEIYRSDKKTRYCSDEGCKRIGQIPAVFSSGGHSSEKRLFKIQLHFGFTEKIATAVDLTTQRSWKVKLNCLL